LLLLNWRRFFNCCLVCCFCLCHNRSFCFKFRIILLWKILLSFNRLLDYLLLCFYICYWHIWYRLNNLFLRLFNNLLLFFSFGCLYCLFFKIKKWSIIKISFWLINIRFICNNVGGLDNTFRILLHFFGILGLTSFRTLLFLFCLGFLSFTGALSCNCAFLQIKLVQILI
jgi:hypothetical protein